jgi:secreted trypsin-like serine protease
MKRSSFVFALAALAACTGAPSTVGTASQGIINGTTDSGDPAVVLLFAAQSGSNMASLCTAEIISPHVLLTAAHCVAPATVGTGVTFHVYIGAVFTTPVPANMLLTVKETHFDSAFDSMHPENGHDVGVVILTDATTIAPIAYNRTAIPTSMVGSAARLVGYGITSGSDTMGTSAGTRRQAPSTLAKLDNLFVGLQDGSHGICEGDSGGPAFMSFGGTERIVGVTSFGFNGCPLTSPQAGYEAGNDTRIDMYASFIDGYVAMFDPPAKGPGDMCTSDAECDPRQCTQTSVGKICAQSCDPAAMPSTCPAGTTCTDVDGTNLCVSNASGGGSGGSGGGGGNKGGGCAIGGNLARSDGALLPFAALALLGLALRRRATR